MKTIWQEASAGSGKTTFLLSCLKNNLELSEVLFLTFSNAAVSQMSLRIKELEYEASKKIKISTLHSLAYSIVLEKYPNKQIAKNSLRKNAILKMLQDNEFLELINWITKNSEINIQNFEEKNECFNEIKLESIEKKEAGIEVDELLKNLENNEIIEYKKLLEIKLKFYTKNNELRKKIKLENYDHLSKIEMEKLIDWALERVNIHEKYLNNYTSWIVQKITNLINSQEEKIKEENDLIYYDDLIIKANEIITDANNFDVFFKYFSNIKMLLIDEAQDLSTKQLNLIFNIINEWKELNGMLVIASDPKQLIYDFQGANLKDFYKFKNEIKKISYIFEERKLDNTYRLPKKICNYLNQVFKEENKDNFIYNNHTTMREIDGEVLLLKIENYFEIIDYIKEKNIKESIMILFKQKSERVKELASIFLSNGYLLNSEFALQHPIIKDFQYLLKWICFKDKFALGILFNIFEKSNLTFEELIQQDEMFFLNELKEKFQKSNFNLTTLFFNWICFEKVQKFLLKKLMQGKDFWINVLFHYANFYKHDVIAAINNDEDFYSMHLHLFEDGIFFNTIHASKGKEANNVFLLETDFQSKFKNENERLLYVALTRSKENLIITQLKEDYEEKSWAEQLKKSYEEL